MTATRIGNPTNAQLRVLVVDDHALICETVSLALEQDTRLQVETSDTVEAAQAKIAETGRYDVVLLDYSVPGMDELKGLEQLIELNKGGVALFSGVANRHIVERALHAGASGFIPKTTPLRTLGHAIRFIADGDTYLPADFTRQVMHNQSNNEHGLKPRELKVLGYLCQGLQNKEIGRHLDMDETIVKLDMKSICRKLGVRNRTQAAMEARRLGLF
jgi:two-component system, NarL family, nitrate/nitrite response regulator NarL